MEVCTDELQELGPCSLALESADEVARHGDGILLLHAAHRHAQMLCLDDDGNAKRMQGFVDGVLDLCGEAFLHLQTARVGFNDAGYLAETCDVAIRDVGHMCLADEWNHVVLAK